MKTTAVVIIYRLGDRYVTLETERDARCLRPDEAWVIGNPQGDRESYNLWLTVQPVLSLLPPSQLHTPDWHHGKTKQAERGLKGDVFVDEFAFYKRKARR